MLFIDWKPITETDSIPPFGEELAAHINSYKGKVRQASCSAWNLLYQMLISMNIPPCHVTFSETGKPYFTDADISFSISHSKDICVVAVADRQIGVDVEVIKDNYKPHLIERTLTEREKKNLTAISPACGAAKKRWSRCPAMEYRVIHLTLTQQGIVFGRN